MKFWKVLYYLCIALKGIFVAQLAMIIASMIEPYL